METSHFYKFSCPNGKYRLECCLVIYQNTGKPYPPFLEPYKGSEENGGYNTKFYIALTDDIDDTRKISNKVKKYRQKYDKILSECETTGDWSKFPFNPDAPEFEIAYYK